MYKKGSRRAVVSSECLFPSELEIARLLNQDPEVWAAKAAVLERAGLPQIDPLMGGRFWPAVLAFLRKRYGLSDVEAFAIDGQENLDAF